MRKLRPSSPTPFGPKYPKKGYPEILMAQSRHDLHTLGPKVGMIKNLGSLGEYFGFCIWNRTYVIGVHTSYLGTWTLREGVQVAMR